MWTQFMVNLSNLMAGVDVRDEKGQGLVEYSLIIALVSVALVGALGILAGDIGGVFTKIGLSL